VKEECSYSYCPKTKTHALSGDRGEENPGGEREKKTVEVCWRKKIYPASVWEGARYGQSGNKEREKGSKGGDGSGGYRALRLKGLLASLGDGRNPGGGVKV